MSDLSKYGFVPAQNYKNVNPNLKKYGFQAAQPSTESYEQEEEGLFSHLGRTAGAAATGYASGTPYGIASNLLQLLAMGELYDPEGLSQLRLAAEQQGIPFDEEKYMEAAQQILGGIPTPSNLARMAEEQTGLPITAKEDYQKLIELGATAGRATPGAISQKATGAVVSPTVSHGLQEAGVPEQFADPLGLLVGGIGSTKVPEADIGIGIARKESGLPTRKFEKVKEPRTVSEKKLDQINTKLESDFKEISDKIISESPVGETFENLKENPTYKQESRELLNEAQNIADAIPGHIESKLIKKAYADMASKKVKGFALDEFDKSYLKFMKESIEDVIPEKISHGELVQQYRKNNRGLSEYFEPGASKALNRAKKQALLDQNRAIADVIEKSEPELSKVFKEGNERWSKIMDAETVDSFIDDLFSEKVNFKKLHDFFDKSGYDFTFKRALGEKGYKNFELLMKDMLQSETPYKMLKVGKQKGFFKDAVETGTAFLVHPFLGKGKLAYAAGKKLYKSAMNAMLDKPQLTVTWKKAIDNLKKGKFAEAEKQFEALRGEVEEDIANILQEKNK